MSRAGLHGSKWSIRNRLMAKRRFLPNQKTVYDLKLLVIFLKKSVIFLKKLVMFYQSLAAPCCSPVHWLIIYKSALDKICLIHDVKGWICKISSTTWSTELFYPLWFLHSSTLNCILIVWSPLKYLKLDSFVLNIN